MQPRDPRHRQAAHRLEQSAGARLTPTRTPTRTVTPTLTLSVTLTLTLTLTLILTLILTLALTVPPQARASGLTVFDEIAKDKEIVKMVLLLTGSFEGAKRQVRN